MTKGQLANIQAYAKRAMAKSVDPQHQFDHVQRVRQNALEIVHILKISRLIDTRLLQAICLLHDVAYSIRRPGFLTILREIKYARQVLKQDLSQFNLSIADRYLLEEAIYHHKGPFPFRRLGKKYSLYAQILQDADSLEFISHTRLATLLNFSKYKSRFYRLISLFSGLYIKRLNNKKRLKKHFNLPEIIDYLLTDNDSNNSLSGPTPLQAKKSA